MKSQSVVAPSGLIASLCGPVEVKRRISGMLMDSGLLNKLQKYLFGQQNQRPLRISGDPAYLLRVHLQAGFKKARLSQQQVDCNIRVGEVRVSVE